MKGSKEISAGGRKTLSVAIIADGNLPGARAICTSYCLATGSQILKITNKGSSHSVLSCGSSKSRELPRIVPLMTWLEVRFESSMKSCSRPGWLLQQICESQISFVLTLFLLSVRRAHTVQLQLITHHMVSCTYWFLLLKGIQFCHGGVTPAHSARMLFPGGNSCCEVVPRKSLQRAQLHNGLTTNTVWSEMSSQRILLGRSSTWENTRAKRDCIFYIFMCLFYFKRGGNIHNFLFLKAQLSHGWLPCLQQHSPSALTALLVCKCQARNYQSIT